MTSDLRQFIQNVSICDTHEHMKKEQEWLDFKPDILCELFQNYVPADLAVAGASGEAVKRLLDPQEPDIEQRFEGVRAAWEAITHTGYGEAVRLIAQRFFGLEQLDGKRLATAQEKLPPKWSGGERLRILKEDGGLDHIQVDDFCWACSPDRSGPEFFLYDLSWASFCNGDLKQRNDLKAGIDSRCEQLFKETGVDVKDLESLRAALNRLFELYGPCAVAVKAQHAYNRTLVWSARTDAEAAAALREVLLDPTGCSVETKNCLGDWCWARGVELAFHHNLPFKIHTGYYAGHSRMPVDFIRPGNLCALLAHYPKARFVLMHIGYPYDDEIVALAKHYPNVWVDLCWAWSINPRASAQFVRRFLHAAPANKLFGFGGDTSRPRAAVAYALQCRKWLAKALQAEVDEGELTEAQAIAVARRLLQENQRACFDIEGVRRRIGERMAKGGS